MRLYRVGIVYLGLLTLLAQNSYAAGFDLEIGGYLREHLSMNLEDPPETDHDDKFELSMARTTLQLEAYGQINEVQFGAVGRLVREWQTPYLERLEEIGANDGKNLVDSRYDDEELREFWLQLNPTENLMLRLGKQQIVWGETDFFQAMDIVHGFDYTWRSFLEPENEDYRKPLILANAMLDVPSARGSLQAFLRPGLDDEEDIGNTYDMFGGRWALQPNKGVNFLNPVPYNFHHSEGDTDDLTGGIRWMGIAGPVSYSFSYLRSFGPDPIVNSAFNPWKEAPKGELGDFIFPKVDLIGVTGSYAVQPPIDAVFSAEVAYIFDRPYNVGSNFFDGALPGFGGVEEKDTIRAMIRMDRTIDTMKLLGTNKPSFFSVQIFDTWIVDYDEDDDIVDLTGFGAKKKEHSALITAILGLNYMSDRINPQIAAGYDLTYGGGFVIPSITFAFGDKWRVLVEADLFFPDDDKDPGEVETDTHLIGWFANNSQLAARITYQF